MKAKDKLGITQIQGFVTGDGRVSKRTNPWRIFPGIKVFLEVKDKFSNAKHFSQIRMMNLWGFMTRPQWYKWPNMNMRRIMVSSSAERIVQKLK